MSTIFHANAVSIESLLNFPATLNVPTKKWHSAFTKIYCSRTLLSLAEIAKAKKGVNKASRSPSYTVVNLQHDDESFKIDQTSLVELVKMKDLDKLHEFGGIRGVASALETDFDAGIFGNDQDIARRHEAFSSNTYKKPPSKSLFYFVVDALKDLTILILLGSGSNFTQNRQFDKFSKVSNNIQIDVIRNGRRQQISIFEIVVGDVICLKIGDQVPANGLFLDGHSLQVDESSMTGESDHVEVNSSQNPFLFSGTKVADGYARMLATSVGMNTTWGQMMSQISRDNSEQTPLQARLNKLTSSTGKIGLAVAFLVLVVLLVRYFTGNTTDENGNQEYNGSKTKVDDIVNAVVGIVAAAVTIIVVAIPEGLPLAVTLTLAYSMKRMMADQAMVRKLSAFALNTTGSVYRETSVSDVEFSGSPTEKAILSWAVLEMNMDMEAVKQSCIVLHVEAFHSKKKRSGVMMQKKTDNTGHVHWKGAAEMILAMCSSYYDASGNIKDLDDGEKERFQQIIQGMAARPMSSRGKESWGRLPICWSEHQDDHRRQRPGQDTSTGAVLEGEEFRNYTHEERMEKVDKICVMARSSPLDKLLMVQCLKQKGHVVAVTGDGTNDAPALKEADIGLSMGIQGTEVAKESSDIVILDDNFASVATVLRWGRCVYTNIQKLIQFQLTANVAALLINFVAAVSAGEIPLTAVQLLWVNLIMDTLGALALATEKPTKELMDKPPVGRTEPLITNIMWRNLVAQALYQRAVLLTLQFRGESIFGVNKKVKDTLIFNTFVLCQVFNEFNSRKLEKKNVFEGIHKNRLFLGIIGTTIVLQVVMVEFLKKFADTERLNWGQWSACIGFAAASWPIGWLVKCIRVPAKPFSSYLKWKKYIVCRYREAEEVSGEEECLRGDT
ncbi:putative calcium-transporting ATPase 13 plasma membrane-type [Citrus sinensis]|uniref:Calcium-transporting ATPase 13 plasma membrane-type n=1 Tax=Citrus sinensis TaxID=2711 RepID=A0ACB8I5X7_CITSI|nr:putative calcium-transporting ATPase 13 plasma membrane-type [Citrus sinensis]